MSGNRGAILVRLKATSLGRRATTFKEGRLLRRRLQDLSPHDHRMIGLYSQFIAGGDLCFDVGANLGSRTKVFAAIGARVVAVEPQEHCARILKTAFRHSSQVEVVQTALGDAHGEADMRVSSAHTLSSLSPQWIDAVSVSGRFEASGARWDTVERVKVRTLDELISSFGVPRFIKIDVEGFEYHVLRGLSRRIECVSFECTPEVLQTTQQCVAYLETLGNARFNYSPGESMALALGEWVTGSALMDSLAVFSEDSVFFGDVYALTPEAAVGVNTSGTPALV